MVCVIGKIMKIVKISSVGGRKISNILSWLFVYMWWNMFGLSVVWVV